MPGSSTGSRGGCRSSRCPSRSRNGAAGFDADEVDAVAAAAQIRGALLAIADGADDRMPEAVVRRVFDAHPGPKRMWVAPDAPHVGASLHPDYWPTVTAFLAENGM